MAEAASKQAWYRMDNAGVMYSALQNDEYSSVYRFSAFMTDPVDPEALQRAITRIMPRFPGFSVRIRKGLFWYYMEPQTAPGPFLQADVADPCRPMRFDEDDGWLVKFYYYDHRISFEVFHALSDGAGALTVFRTLLAEYLRQRGIDIPCEAGVLSLDEPPDPREMEDAYSKSAGPRARRAAKAPKAYQNLGRPEPFFTFHVTMGFLPVDQVKAAAARYGVSITEYLASVLLWVLMEKQAREKPLHLRPVALAVPINLRPYFDSHTLRNFILTLRPEIDPALGEYSFEEVVSQVHHYLRLHASRQELQSVITANVRIQSNRLARLVPVFLKNPVVGMRYRALAARPYSATFTNPGAFRVPAAMQPHIRHMEVILGPSILPRSSCASISYGNTLELTFAGTGAESELERDFFRFLVRQGLPVRIESNR